MAMIALHRRVHGSRTAAARLPGWHEEL